jgi:hypothetical protein
MLIFQTTGLEVRKFVRYIKISFGCDESDRDVFIKKVEFNLKLKPELKFERESTLMCMTSRRQSGDNGRTEKNN